MQRIAAIVALCAGLFVSLAAWRWWTNDKRHSDQITVGIAILILMASTMVAAAGPSHRPRAWCGWWLGQHLGMTSSHLWVARNWARVGSSAGGPHVGAIVVWRHHVGIITGRNAFGWVVKSGNDGGAVRERPRSVAGAIAFRRI
jgi:hypothetical protein